MRPCAAFLSYTESPSEIRCTLPTKVRQDSGDTRHILVVGFTHGFLTPSLTSCSKALSFQDYGSSALICFCLRNVNCAEMIVMLCFFR